MCFEISPCHSCHGHGFQMVGGMCSMNNVQVFAPAQLQSTSFGPHLSRQCQALEEPFSCAM